MRSPWVLRVIVEFSDDRIVLWVAFEICINFKFKWTGQIALNIKNLTVKEHKGVSVASVFEDEGIDSLSLNSGGVFVVEGVLTVKSDDGALVAWHGVVSVHVDAHGGFILLKVAEVNAFVRALAASPDLGVCWIVSADGKVMWGPLDAGIVFENVIPGWWDGNRGGGFEILTLDSNGASGILILDSELPVDESSAHVLSVWSNFDASLGFTEHLDHHLVVRDPWSHAESVGEEEGVVVVGANISKGDGVWLLSASAHAEDLVAVWVVVVVLVLSGVWHQEGEVVSRKEWVAAPVVDTIEVVGLRVLEPASGLVVSVASLPVLVLILGKFNEWTDFRNSPWAVCIAVDAFGGKVSGCDDSEAFIDGELFVVVSFIFFTVTKTVN